MMTFYFILIGIVIIAVEMEKGSFNQWFLFLNFGWGKVYLYMFLFCAILSFTSRSWLQWVIAICLLIASFMNLYLNRKYKDKELERVKQIIDRIQTRSAQAEV